MAQNIIDRRSGTITMLDQDLNTIVAQRATAAIAAADRLIQAIKTADIAAWDLDEAKALPIGQGMMALRAIAAVQKTAAAKAKADNALTLAMVEAKEAERLLLETDNWSVVEETMEEAAAAETAAAMAEEVVASTSLAVAVAEEEAALSAEYRAKKAAKRTADKARKAEMKANRWGPPVIRKVEVEPTGSAKPAIPMAELKRQASIAASRAASAALRAQQEAARAEQPVQTQDEILAAKKATRKAKSQAGPQKSGGRTWCKPTKGTR